MSVYWGWRLFVAGGDPRPAPGTGYATPLRDAVSAIKAITDTIGAVNAITMTIAAAVEEHGVCATAWGMRYRHAWLSGRNISPAYMRR